MLRSLWASLLLSLILHLTALFLVDRLFLAEREVRAFRARLATAPRFVPQSRFQTAAPTLLSIEMEFTRSRAEAASVPEGAVPLVAEAAPVAPAPLETYDPTLPKRDGAELVIETLPDPTAPSAVDTAAFEAMELLRIEDLIRADAERAVIVPDVYSRRDTRGFVKFTPLRLNGAWSFGLDALQGGRPVLADLARYVRDHTQVHAEVRGFPVEYFNTPQLKKDPLHFLFPGLQRGVTNEPRIALGPGEQGLLGEYLRGGGFLFVDAGQGPGDRRFLREMVALLEAVLAAGGRFFALPADHPVYHAYYSYENGFPGEIKRPVADIAGSNWYYPDRAPCSSGPPRGLYGVEWAGQTVAVISDLELHRRWSGLPLACAEEEVEATPAEGGEGAAAEEETPVMSPYLEVATNIVFYALTRPGGVAVKRQAPAWRPRRVQTRRPEASPVESKWVAEDGELFDELEASLAFLRAPLGKAIGAGGLRLRIEGYGEVEVVDGRLHGVLLRNLRAGRCWIEVEYGDEQQGMEIELRGGVVTTVAFAVRGLGFWTSLSLEALAARFAVADWSERFGDLRYDEIFAPQKNRALVR